MRSASADRASAIDTLTGLRGIAATSVVLYHFTYHIVQPQPFTGAASIFLRGYLAVDLFFLLSGFVLAHVYGREFAARVDATGYARFVWARFARIYPVHIAVLLPMLLLLGREATFSGKPLVFNLLLLQGPWLPDETWNSPSWSISAEWHAYLVFPFVAAAIARMRTAVAAILALCCLAALGFIGWQNAGDLRPVIHGPLSLLRSFPEFVAGILVYRLYAGRWMAGRAAADGPCLAVALAIMLLAMVPASDVAIVVLLALLLLLSASNRGRTAALLTCRPVAFAGEISYSLYMVHFPVLLAVLSLAGIFRDTGSLLRPLLFALALLLSFVIATLTSRAIEYPARAFLRKLPLPPAKASTVG